MKKWLFGFILLQTLLVNMAIADINAALSHDTLSLGESLQLTYEVLGDPSSNPPDLSPLQQDFTIMQRNVRHSTRSFNGRTSQKTTLILTLSPRSEGALQIPPIDFGAESSRALSIRVLPKPANEGSAGATAETLPEFPAAAFSPWLQPYGAPAWMPLGAMPGIDQALSNESPNTALPPANAPPPSPAPEQSNFWFWIAMLALAGWAFTALLLLRMRPRRPASPKPSKASAAKTPAPTAKPIDHSAQIKKAYQQNQPFAAKDAWLAWAADAWRDDPPSNLSRLAARCEPALQRQILKLEAALYSPKQTVWNDAAVWELVEQRDTDRQASNAATHKQTPPAATSPVVEEDPPPHYY
jgi:hypothetical protein